MNAREFRALAERCRELLAERDDVREQLRQWAEDFEDEAVSIDKAHDYSAYRKVARLVGSASLDHRHWPWELARNKS